MEKYGTTDKCGKEKLACEDECTRSDCRCTGVTTKCASVYCCNELICPECNGKVVLGFS